MGSKGLAASRPHSLIQVPYCEIHLQPQSQRTKLLAIGVSLGSDMLTIKVE